MYKMIAAAIFALAFGFSASTATADTAAVPPCLMAFGDIWGDEGDTIPKREIDGKTIKTPADLARMTGTREYGVKIIKGGDFSGWDFSKIPLSMVCFHESKLVGANFKRASASGVGFIKSDLTDANLRRADMPGVLFRNANLTNASAQRANFSTGQFDGGWFEGGKAGWNIDGADMSGFKFECGITVPDGCPVYQGGPAMSARKTNFTGATLHSFGLFDWEADGAILDRTILGPAQLPDLSKAEFRGDLILRGGNSDVRITPADARILLKENAKHKNATDKPSFDCAKAQSKVEKEICGEYASELRGLDRDIAALYERARSGGKNVKADQLSWLLKRNKCGDAKFVSDCLRESYDNRKGELLALLGERQWLARGEEALFVDEVLELPAEFSKTALYTKITPALVGASRTDILVKRGKDGLYLIRGSAVGANAHTCGLTANHLYFDKKTGWYSVVSDGPDVPIFRVMGDRLEVFGNGQPDFGKYPDTMNFMSCGVRARIFETRRIAVDEQVLARHRKSFDEQM